MARTKKRNRSDASDDAYNARRRYYRQAERYEKRASEAGTPIEAGRLRKLATRSLEKAIATYEDPTKAKMSRPIQELSQRLSPRKPLRPASAKARKQLIDESESRATVSGMTDDELRDAEAADILSGSIVGKRLYGALVDIWDKDDVGWENRDDAIKEYFGVDSMMDVIEAIEDMGIDIYADPESQERYDEIRTAIEAAFK